jgi:hypothetical protein
MSLCKAKGSDFDPETFVVAKAQLKSLAIRRKEQSYQATKRTMMRAFKSERWRLFWGLLTLGGIFYLVDCFWASQEHPDVPFLKSGFYAGGLFGFIATVACVVGGFLSLIFGKDK